MARSITELRDMDLAALVAELRASKQEALNLRFRNATGQLDKHDELRKVRRQIARINTLIRQREIVAAQRSPRTRLDRAQLIDLRGVDYDDELWDSLLDQISVSEMIAVINDAAGRFTPSPATPPRRPWSCCCR